MKTVFLLLMASFLIEPGRASPAVQEQLAAETRRREQSVQPLQQALWQGEKLAAQGLPLRAWEGLSRVWEIGRAHV